MHRCHVTTEQLLSVSICMDRAQCRHIRNVLRLQEGAELQLFDGHGLTRQARIKTIDKHNLTLQPSAAVQKHPPPTCRLTLLFCISKGKRSDWTIEKATELGISEIIPLISTRTVVRLTQAERQSKAKRWQRVADDAARQSGRAWIPQVRPPLTFAEAQPLLQHFDVLFTAALTNNAMSLKNAVAALKSPPNSAAWLTGPEGDFTTDELKSLCAAGTTLVTLGSNVLRAETAAIYGLCVLNCAWL
jgi:16S rRNA (uracil1498-N3)-methyltransferase